METIHNLKKPGAGILAASLLLVLLLALPCAWYAAYHDQLATPVARSVPFGAAPLTRPSGIITMGPTGSGRIRAVRIQHTGGQIVTTVSDGGLTVIALTTDPKPPLNPLDALGQNLCDRYNAWKCVRGDSRLRSTMPIGAGSMTVRIYYSPKRPIGSVFVMPKVRMPALPAHAPGTRAPGSPLHPVAHRPARP